MPNSSVVFGVMLANINNTKENILKTKDNCYLPLKSAPE